MVRAFIPARPGCEPGGCALLRLAFHYSMGGVNEFRQPFRQRVRQWSRVAWAMAFLFASMPAASKLFLGFWGFDGAAEIACLCLVLGTYLHIASRRRRA